MTEFAGWLAIHAGSLDPGTAIAHWGYFAVFVLVILGNAGVPVPEETVLVVAGFLVWSGQLRLDLVLAVGFVSAVVGDNIGYWVGRRFGRGALERHALWILGRPERLGAMQGFVGRRGAMAIFVARFVPGLRFMAGPWRARSGSACGPSSPPTSSGQPSTSRSWSAAAGRSATASATTWSRCATSSAT